MAVEGKWTLRVCACTVATVLDRGPALPTPCERERNISLIPVVPCDGDAVERVARKLAEIQGYHVGPLDIDRRSAETLLRAAGGQ